MNETKLYQKEAENFFEESAHKIPAIVIKDLSFRYFGQSKNAIEVPYLEIYEGETVLIVGKSGGGKSTFVNTINGIIPHVIKGELKGEVSIYGNIVAKTPLFKISTMVGTLMQDPDTQIINYLVEDEVAFGPENLRMKKEEIAKAVDNALAITGIEHLRKRETDKLSGGELQRVALAAVLAMNPSILILDEPTSNIDPEGTETIFNLLKSLKEKKTMIIVEHKVERVLPFVDRIIHIDEGKILLDIRKEQLLNHIDHLSSYGVEIPEYYYYAKKFGIEDVLDIEKIKGAIKSSAITLDSPKRNLNGELMMQAEAEVSVAGRKIIEASLNVNKGQVVAIMGRNGSGKSTFLNAIAGFLGNEYKLKLKLYVEGKDLSNSTIQERGRYVTLLPQTFDLTLITTRVIDEISFSFRVRGEKNYKEKVEYLLKKFSLDKYKYYDPLNLSLGQRRRTAMAAAIASGAKVIMMDEPTSGQDFYHKKMLGEELQTLKSEGYSFVIVTHDSRFAYNYADKVVVFYNGQKVLEGSPEDVFLESARYGVFPPSDYLLRVSSA